jgi:AcrR family transcriptional regulator
MGRPQKSNGQRTRLAVLDAALTLFSEQGYFGASLRDIAAAVGIRESALYNYFPSKEALFQELIVTDQESMGERLFDALEGPIADTRDALVRLATRMLEDFATPRQEQIFRILMSDGVRLARDGRINLFERMSCGRARIGDFVRMLVDAGGLRRTDPELLAIEFMAPLLLWRHMNAVRTQGPATSDPRTFASRHVDLFLTGASAQTGDRAAAAPAIPQAPARPPVLPAPRGARGAGRRAGPGRRAATRHHPRKRTDRP